MESSYPWVKAFHIIFVVSWFAGLFYLPRIFVNLAMHENQHTTPERTRLLGMARRLHKFTGPLMVLALVLGIWLWAVIGIGLKGENNGWMHVKLFLVILLMAFHVINGRILRRFENARNVHSHTWYRVYNEIPVLLLFAIVILVVVKPF